MSESKKFTVFGIIFYFFLLILFIREDKNVVLLLNYPAIVLTRSISGPQNGISAIFILIAFSYNLAIGYLLGRIFFWISAGIKNRNK